MGRGESGSAVARDRRRASRAGAAVAPGPGGVHQRAHRGPARLAAVLGPPFVGHAAYLPHIHLPWWAMALAFAATDMFVLHVQARRETQSISLSEIPLVLGLHFAAPMAMLAGRLIGSAAVMVAYRRSPPLKIVFNLSLARVGDLPRPDDLPGTRAGDPGGRASDLAGGLRRRLRGRRHGRRRHLLRHRRPRRRGRPAGAVLRGRIAEGARTGGDPRPGLRGQPRRHARERMAAGRASASCCCSPSAPTRPWPRSTSTSSGCTGSARRSAARWSSTTS